MSYRFEDYTVKIFFDKRDNEYGAYIEEIPEVSAYGETHEKVISELQQVFRDWQDTATEKQIEIPPPADIEEYSGKFVVRIPKSLHKRLAQKAREENVSLNQEVLYCITRGLKAS